ETGAMQTVTLGSPERAPKTVGVRYPACKVAKMLLKRLAKPWNSHQFESAVAQPVITACERDYPWFPAIQQGGFDRNLNGLKPRITQRCFPPAKSPSLERYLTQFLT